MGRKRRRITMPSGRKPSISTPGTVKITSFLKNSIERKALGDTSRDDSSISYVGSRTSRRETMTKSRKVIGSLNDEIMTSSRKPPEGNINSRKDSRATMAKSGQTPREREKSSSREDSPGPSKSASRKRPPLSEESKQSRKSRKSSDEKAKKKSITEKSKTVKKRSSVVSKTGKSVKTKPPKTEEHNEDMPKHMRAITVSRKTFQKWQPLSNSTKQDTVKLIDSVIPLVLNGVSDENETIEEIQKDLSLLKQRIVEELGDVKGPRSKGNKISVDHIKSLQESLIYANSELEFLEDKLEEEEGLLENEKQEVKEYKKKLERFREKESQRISKLHPLLNERPINTLHLSESPSFKHDLTFKVTPEVEEENRHLITSLNRLSGQASKLGVQQWSERVSSVGNRLAEMMEDSFKT